MSSKNSPPDPNPERILVVRLGAMGDVIHALPAVSTLAQALPQARIDWIIEPQWTCLLQDNPYLNSFIPFRLKDWRKRPLRPSSWADLRSLAGDLRSRRYDLILDIQGLIKSASLARLVGAPRRAGFETVELREPLAARLYTEQLHVTGTHIVDKNISAVTSLLGTTPGPIEFPLPKGEFSPALPAGDFILATPVAGWGSKQWPARHYAKLARLIHEEFQIPLVLDCAPNDLSYIREIACFAPAGSTVVHPSSIPQLIGATRRARAVVGVDSGPLHLAAALNKPGVAIFGPTDPARNGPYGSSFKVLRDRGASTSYQRSAPISATMSAISAAQVYAELQLLIHPVQE